MHEVSKAINILDPTEGIDKKICGTKWVSSGSASSTANQETPEKCFNGNKNTNSKPSGFDKLSDMFKTDDTNKNSYPVDASSKMGDHTSATISKDVSSLTNDQKGKVSSAFAKAHEGAEIVMTQGRARYTSKMYIY